MVKILGPDGNPVEPKLLLTRHQVIEQVINPAAEALYHFASDKELVVIIPALVAGIFPIWPIFDRINDLDPDMANRFWFFPIWPSGGNEQGVDRQILSGLQLKKGLNVEGLPAVVIDTVVETKKSYCKAINHPSVRNAGFSSLELLALIKKGHYFPRGESHGLGNPFTFDGPEWVIGANLGCDLGQFFRTRPNLETIPVNSSIDPASLPTKKIFVVH